MSASQTSSTDPAPGVTGPAVTAAASRPGTDGESADAAAVYVAADGTTAAAVVDGIGHAPATVALAPVLAEVAVRTGAVRGALAGLLNAGLLIADRGPDGHGPNAVAALAVSTPGRDTVAAWAGDCRIHGFDGIRLHRYSTDHTVGEQLRRNGVPWELVAEHDAWLRVTLAQATPASVYEVVIPADELVLLTSDGVHDQLDPDSLESLVREHHDAPQALADALVAAVRSDDDGYRDDATALVLAPPTRPQPPGSEPRGAAARQPADALRGRLRPTPAPAPATHRSVTGPAPRGRVR
ncbi:SpoIIE family protein phosphatase [Streptomyces varsoviensis]|uniref:SpoIIE family protein phosphatase n=1 Tax=Streptomyces varsoviensis TaxID=67373 RepID=UPI001FE1D429|nr:SpoIIE family protein phosphatase [Streptomyces varsoviensis]